MLNPAKRQVGGVRPLTCSLDSPQCRLPSLVPKVGKAAVVGDSAIVTVNFKCGSAKRSGQSDQTEVVQLIEEATQNVKDDQTYVSGNARVYLEKRDGAWELCYTEGLVQEIAHRAGFFEACDTALGLLNGQADATVDANNTDYTGDAGISDNVDAQGDESAVNNVDDANDEGNGWV